MFIILLGRLTMGVLFILKKQVGVDQGTEFNILTVEVTQCDISFII